MKALLLSAVLLTNGLTIIAQSNLTDSLNRDPRRFIKIYQVANHNEEPGNQGDIIWEWEANSSMIDGGRGRQIHNIVNIDDNIRIVFDFDEIINDLFHSGDITISASILRREGGESPIEVLPYSRIGEDYMDILGDRKSSNELAIIFYNFMSAQESYSQLFKAIESVGRINEIAFTLNHKYEELQSMFEEARSLNKSNDSTFALEFEDEIWSMAREVWPIEDLFFDQGRFWSATSAIATDSMLIKFPDFSLGTADYLDVRIASVLSDLGNYVERFNRFSQEISSKRVSGKLLTYLKSVIDYRLGLALEYLNYFLDQGKRVKDVFLAFILGDEVLLNRLEERLKEDRNSINNQKFKNLNELKSYNIGFEDFFDISSALSQPLSRLNGYHGRTSSTSFYFSSDGLERHNLSRSEVIRTIA
ncbi:MAG: hypothetical protein AAFN65_03655, partial [Bacteroidota bacterium]